MRRDLESEFHDAMVAIYNSAKRACGYNATRFLQVLSNKGGVQTARDLLSTDEVQYGFTELWECGRLDLTVEAHVLKPEFRELFTEVELRRAYQRLEELEYYKGQ